MRSNLAVLGILMFSEAFINTVCVHEQLRFCVPKTRLLVNAVTILATLVHKLRGVQWLYGIV